MDTLGCTSVAYRSEWSIHSVQLDCGMTRPYFLVAISNDGNAARPVRPGEPVAKYERVMKSDFLRPRTPQADGTVHEVSYEYSIEHARAIREADDTKPAD